MRRKKDDKRVLFSPQNNRRRSSNNRRISFPQRQQNNRRRQPKPRKWSNGTVFVIILALIAFVVGAGAGISLALDLNEDNGPTWHNVTKEMTTNLTDDNVTYDKEVDGIDYNDNQTVSELNLTVEPSY